MRQEPRGHITKPVDPAELIVKIDALSWGCCAFVANR